MDATSSAGDAGAARRAGIDTRGPEHAPAIGDLGWVSADSHVNEPRDLWKEHLPASLRDQAMQGIAAGEDGGWAVLFDGAAVDQASAYETDRWRVSDPEHRHAVMREEGIVGEAVFPTIGLYVWMLTDPAGGRASCRVYNEWIADGLARSPRFRCAGLVPTWNVDDALDEVTRIVDAGLGALMVPAAATPAWNHPGWEPLWAAFEETGLPVVIHQGTGHDMHFYRGAGAGVSNLLATQSMGPRTAALLATSGVLAAHPDLHVVFVEFNVGWLAWTMQTLDFYTESLRRYGTTPAGKPWVNPELPEPPSAYLRRQVHATFQDDPIGLHNIAFTGDRALLWGSDYPHEEGTYPRSREVVTRLAAGLDPAAAARVFRDNAAALFHFSDEVLTQPV
ncbi:MAG: amidohydrolase [Acidimicrobiia bacterium]